MASIAQSSLTIPRSVVLATLLALSMLTSSIVFSEPAPTDIFMAGFLVAFCILGGARIGTATTINLACWLPLIALGMLATVLSPEFGKALKHQVVTLFLVLGSAGIAGFIAANPVPRTKLILNCYTIGIAIACVLAYIGYFRLLPDAYELFTRYGRARGTFKDPNVFGAAIAPAVIYVCWQLLRNPFRHALLPAAAFVFMAPALILTFSRGAWISIAVSLIVLAFFALTRTRRVSDHLRMVVYAVVGLATLMATITAVLQIPEVSDLMRQRASLSQSYDEGPEGRFGGQKKAIELIINNPAGIGTHTFRERHHHEEVHNVFLTQFHNAGWVGGLFFLITIGLTFAFGISGSLRVGELQGGFVIATAAFAGLIVEGLVIDSDHWRHLFIVIGLIWGLSDAAERRLNRPHRATDNNTTNDRAHHVTVRRDGRRAKRVTLHPSRSL